MWLSETKKRGYSEQTQAAVLMVGDEAHELLMPANIIRIPKSGEKQLTLFCPDGSSVQIGVIGGELPSGLAPGEIYIKTDNADITVKNNGAVNIDGTVNITGSLTVNGVTI